MANLFGNLFGNLTGRRRTEAQRLYNLELSRLGQTLSSNLNAPSVPIFDPEQMPPRDAWARAAQGSLQHGPGNLLSGQLHAMPAQEIYFGRGIGTSDGNMFTRWMDIRESEDELQEFLIKCTTYGAKMQNPTRMNMTELEK